MRAGAFHQEGERAEQHAQIGARFVRHAPEARARQLLHVENPEVVTAQDGDLGRDDSHDHDHNQRNRGGPREQADNPNADCR